MASNSCASMCRATLEIGSAVYIEPLSVRFHLGVISPIGNITPDSLCRRPIPLAIAYLQPSILIEDLQRDSLRGRQSRESYGYGISRPLFHWKSKIQLLAIGNMH